MIMETPSGIPERSGEELKAREKPSQPTKLTPEEAETQRKIVNEFSAALQTVIDKEKEQDPQTIRARMTVVPHFDNQLNIGFKMDSNSRSSELYCPWKVTFYPDSIWVDNCEVQYESEFPLDHKAEALEYLSKLIAGHGITPVPIRMSERPFGDRDAALPGEKVVYRGLASAREAATALFSQTKQPVSIEYRNDNSNDIDPDDEFYKDPNIIHKMTVTEKDGVMSISTDEGKW